MRPGVLSTHTSFPSLLCSAPCRGSHLLEVEAKALFRAAGSAAVSPMTSQTTLCHPCPTLFWLMSQQCHGLRQQAFLMVLEAEKSKMRVPADVVSGEGPLLLEW